MEAELERLRKKLAAQEKTIQALMNRVEGRLASSGSAFAVLEQNIGLEQLVERRTEELERANRNLSSAMAELERSQAEAAAAQRWAAVGTLAAGVAHEINTPLQFVNDSVHFVRDAMADLSDLLSLSTKATQLAGPYQELGEAMRAAVERADLDYLKETLPTAIQRSLDGLERVGTIVRSLKEFAHPGAAEMAAADLNQAIRTTTVIASNEYKYVADLELDLSPLPAVNCHINDVNQVVLNLLVNAAHAVGDVVRGSDRKGKIRVQTALEDGGGVRISVSDTGTGIPEPIRSRIFEPFFTTKEVGKGTGQGLSLVWAMVVNKHGGSVDLESEVGVGTTFHVRLPLGGVEAEGRARAA